MSREKTASKCFGAQVLACAVALAALAGCTSSSVAKQSAAPTSATPMTTSAAPSTSATPSASPTPLSAFEADPAVRAMRGFQYAFGRAINTGKYTSATLRSYSTPYVAKNLKIIVGSDAGTYYPGPAPFQPTGVTVVDSSHRTIRGCLVSTGWGEDRKTHKPAKPLKLTGADFSMVKSSGRWLVNGIPVDKGVSCSTVKVKMPKW